MEAEVTEHDQGSSPVPQEMARLVYERLEAIAATQALHGSALGSILTRLDGHDARFDAVEQQLGAIETRLDGLDARFDRFDAHLDNVVQQMQTNHEGVMALLTELVGRKTE